MEAFHTQPVQFSCTSIMKEPLISVEEKSLEWMKANDHDRTQVDPHYNTLG
jgi:hypothetical protein